MVYDLMGLHDVNSGAVLAFLLVVAIRSKGTGVARVAVPTLAVVGFTMLPLPLHGTPLYGVGAVLAAFGLFYISWGSDELPRIEQCLSLAVLVLLMGNVVIGLHLSGRI